MTDQTPTGSLVESSTAIATEQLCKDACYDRGTPCKYIIFKPAVSCELVLSGDEILTTDASFSGFSCIQKNPLYLPPPAMVYTSKQGICLAADTQAVPVAGVGTTTVVTAEAALNDYAACQALCDGKYCTAF